MKNRGRTVCIGRGTTVYASKRRAHWSRARFVRWLNRAPARYVSAGLIVRIGGGVGYGLAGWMRKIGVDQ